MAAAITTTATSLEGQLVEVATALAILEKDSTATPAPNRIAIGADFENGAIVIQANLGADVEAEGAGFKLIPQTYL